MEAKTRSRLGQKCRGVQLNVLKAGSDNDAGVPQQNISSELGTSLLRCGHDYANIAALGRYL